MKKRIALTPSFSDDGERVQINRDYTECVLRAGAVPVILPLLTSPEDWETILAGVDGLLLTGGADVDPASYGEEKQPFCGGTMPERDVMEIGLCRLALERDMPVLGICRGHQIMNCALGGTLYQDVATQFKPDLRHPVYERPREQVHTVTVKPDSRLAAITGKTELHVNSRHHQAVWKVGEGLTVTVYAPDGLIEGIELPGKKFALGVQWHPESLSSYVDDAQQLIDAFVAAC